MAPPFPRTGLPGQESSFQELTPISSLLNRYVFE